MKSKRICSILLTFVLVLSLIPVQPVEAAKKVKVSKVVVESSLSGSTKQVVVAKGKKVQLKTTVTVTPDKSANKKVTYKSANTKIATVSKKGVVKGVKAGTTKITVTSKKNKKKKATIKVKVTKKAVSKVTLDQTSGTINVGDTVTLTATVTAKKGAEKTLNWSSSNEAVATVNDKGNVVAVSPGSAVITAKAIDGSGKKATYTVTVEDPRYLTAVSVLNNRSVTFSLNKPLALQATDITIQAKTYSNGKYQSKLTIDNISTTDNINYTVVLSDDSYIAENDHVQVSIPSLTGSVKSMESIYSVPVNQYVDDMVITWEKDEYDYYYLSFYGYASIDYSDMGYSTFSIDKLPAGLSAENKNGYLYIKGIPTTAGLTVATMKAEDELGNTLTKTIKFVIYSDDTVVGATTDVYAIYSGDKITNSKSIIPYGGSGYYTYKVISDPSGIVTNANGSGEITDYSGYYYCYLKTQIAAAGTHTVTVRATDVKDSKKYCDISVTYRVEQGITIGGCILDANGNKIPSVYVRYVNKNKASRCQSGYAYTDSKGVYSATILPGTYDITVSYDAGYSEAATATKYLYNQTISASKTGFDISLPLYKVAITEPKDDAGEKISLSGITWYYNHESVGSGSTLYLKAGTYTLETKASLGTMMVSGDWFNGGSIKAYKGSATFTITNAGVQTSVNKVPFGDATVVNGAKNTTYVVNSTGRKYWLDSDCEPYYAYYFTPTTTGEYYLNSYDCTAYIWDSNGKKLGTSATLTKGQKYYIATGTGCETYGYFYLYLND